MSPEENKAILQRYLEEAWSNQNWEVAEEVIAEDVVFHDQIRDDDLPPGRDSVRLVMGRMFTATPDGAMQVHQMIAEGDTVAVRYSWTGTHVGDFAGIPATGRAVRFDAISMVRFQDGRIVEGWQESDRMGLAQQIGVMPKGQMPRPIASALVAVIRLKDRLSRRRRLQGSTT